MVVGGAGRAVLPPVAGNAACRGLGDAVDTKRPKLEPVAKAVGEVPDTP